MPRQHGLTLLELLVVLTIIGLVSALVSFSLRDTSQRLAEQEAQRLAAQLDAARALARSNGLPLTWRPTPQGFAFDAPPGFQPLPPAQRWLAPNTQASLQVGDQPALQVALGPEPVLPPTHITLVIPADNGTSSARVRIGTDGLRPFQVEP